MKYNTRYAETGVFELIFFGEICSSCDQNTAKYKLAANTNKGIWYCIEILIL